MHQIVRKQESRKTAGAPDTSPGCCLIRAFLQLGARRALCRSRSRGVRVMIIGSSVVVHQSIDWVATREPCRSEKRQDCNELIIFFTGN
jgi:hypothetical protein